MPAHYTVELRAAGASSGASPILALGRLDAAHLADHPAAEAALADAVVDGSDLGPLLVLERLEVLFSSVLLQKLFLHLAYCTHFLEVSVHIFFNRTPEALSLHPE